MKRKLFKTIGISLALISLSFFLFPSYVSADCFGSPIGPGPEPPPPPDCEECCQGCCPCCDEDECNPCAHTRGDITGPSLISSINIYTGSLLHKQTDLTIPGFIPIKIDRTYSSTSQYDSPLGFGWSFYYNMRLYQYSDNSVIIRSACGTKMRFEYNGGAYQSPVSASGTLTEEGGIFTYTFKQGKKFIFDIQGRLSSIVDQSGNSLVFKYDLRGKLPLIGVSPYAISTNPVVVSYDYRLIKIEEKDSSGALTGRYVDYSYGDSTGRIDFITDSNGRKVDYAHDSNGNLTSVTLKDSSEAVIGDSYSYGYGASPSKHLITSISGGNCPECKGTYYYTYHPLGTRRVVYETHSDGGVTEIQYTKPLLETKVIKTVKNNLGVPIHTAQFTYQFDSDGYPTVVIDPYGHKTEYIRDFGGDLRTHLRSKRIWENIGPTTENPVWATNPTVSIDYIYFPDGNMERESIILDSGEEIVKEWTYDHGWIASEQTYSSLNPEKNFRTEYTFYKNGGAYPMNIHEEKRVTGYNGEDYSITTYEYDDNGQLSKIIRPNNDIENYIYTDGYLTNANGIQYTYDDRGNRKTITDRNGKITTFDYDLLDRVTKVTNPLGEETIYTYVGKLLTQVEAGKDGVTHITKYNHDSLDRVESVVKVGDAGDVTIAQYTYDSEDNILTVKDADGNATTLTYDLLNRPKTVKEPGKTAYTEYFYDALGNRTKVTDANEKSTQYNYDDLGRLKMVKDVLDKTTEYTYDAVRNLIKVKDARNNETTYEYDLLSRLTKETKPLGQTTEYFYDAKGRLDYEIDSKDQKIKYHYRELDDALAGIDYFATSTSTSADRTVDLDLDANANILTVFDSSIGPGAIYTYTYDDQKRLDTVTAHYVNKYMDYDYDQFGNRASLTVREGDASGTLLFEYTYSYNMLNQLNSLTGPGSVNDITTFDCWHTGRMKTKTFPNNVTSNYYFSANGNLETLTYTSSTGASLLNLSYTYGNVSNIDTKNKDGVVYDYGYDDLYQLTGATIPSATVQNKSFTYDPVGNRLTSGPSSPLLSYSYDNNNQLNSYNGVSFGYDDNGNTVSKIEGGVTASYGYDIENRLVTYSNETISASYKYDFLGRRVKKEVNDTITQYLWDGNVIIAELNASNNITKLYTYNPQNNEPISMTEGSDTYYFLNDHLMTPQKMVDSSGAVVWSAEYKAFGEATVDEDPDGDGTPATNNLRFPGQYYDQETGLHYNYFRYYDPITGRYLREDPMVGTLLFSNLFIYTNNNPIINIDPSGLIKIPGMGEMDCTLIKEEREPTISKPPKWQSLGKLVICSKILYTESSGCTCIGYWANEFVKYHDRIKYILTYECCPPGESNCPDKCKITRTDTIYISIPPIYKCERIPGKEEVTKTGVSYGWPPHSCDACWNGVGQPM